VALERKTTQINSLLRQRLYKRAEVSKTATVHAENREKPSKKSDLIVILFKRKAHCSSWIKATRGATTTAPLSASAGRCLSLAPLQMWTVVSLPLVKRIII